MCKTWKIGGFLVLALLVGVALVLPGTRQAAFGGATDDAKMAGPAHYTVVMTEGHNLLVTANASNKLYFYTIDKANPIPSPLTLPPPRHLPHIAHPDAT